jgi:hypothetical protein
MAGVSPITAHRLSVQGFSNVDEAWLAEIAPWLRFSPALCAMAAAVGTLTGSPAILLALAATAFLGAVLPFHPFDLIYNYGIRFWIGRRPLPSNGMPRRIACGIASIWLVGTALLFSVGATMAGYALGGLFVAVATLVSTTDICIPSMMLYYLGRLRRTAS